MRPALERDIETENGGPGVYNVNLKKNYLLDNPEWNQDAIPEILDGKNIADFLDADIAEKLDALEREEERLVTEGFYESDHEMLDSEEEETKQKAHKIREVRKLKLMAHHLKAGKKGLTAKKKVLQIPREVKIPAKQLQKEERGFKNVKVFLFSNVSNKPKAPKSRNLPREDQICTQGRERPTATLPSKSPSICLLAREEWGKRIDVDYGMRAHISWATAEHKVTHDTTWLLLESTLVPYFHLIFNCTVSTMRTFRTF